MNIRLKTFIIPQIREIGYQIITTTRLPLTNRMPRPITEEQFKKGTFLERKDVKIIFGIEEMDIRDKKAMHDLLRNGERAMRDIAKSRVNLATFIRENFAI